MNPYWRNEPRNEIGEWETQQRIQGGVSRRKAKRKVSPATKRRLKALRKKFGLGEFKKGAGRKVATRKLQPYQPASGKPLSGKFVYSKRTGRLIRRNQTPKKKAPVVDSFANTPPLSTIHPTANEGPPLEEMNLARDRAALRLKGLAPFTMNPTMVAPFATVGISPAGFVTFTWWFPWL